MQRLIVDMDGVLADAFAQYQAYHQRDTGQTKPLAELVGRPEMEAFPRAHEYVRQAGFFRTMPVMAGSRETMDKLNQKYEVFVVSAAMEYPNSLVEKFDWLGEHFPFITWHRIVMCGSKRVIRGDIMIDDYIRNLDNFIGRTIMFNQPHNQPHQVKHERVHSWDEVARLLL